MRQSSKVIPISKSSPPRLGRKPEISREDILSAALELLGPHRSIATLSLREIARAADIAPNSFYRHFRDTDELAVALIEQAGESLRDIIWKARSRVEAGDSVIRASVETFLYQLQSNPPYLPLLLREGAVGSNAFKKAVDRQLEFFETELQADLIRLSEANDAPLHDAPLTARAITRLVFAMATAAMDLPRTRHPQLITDISEMVRVFMVGTQTLATGKDVK
jgi:AcrR family transcriptional regulator